MKVCGSSPRFGSPAWPNSTFPSAAPMANPLGSKSGEAMTHPREHSCRGHAQDWCRSRAAASTQAPCCSARAHLRRPLRRGHDLGGWDQSKGPMPVGTDFARGGREWNDTTAGLSSLSGR
jgi:hypothetical protein